GSRSTATRRSSRSCAPSRSRRTARCGSGARAGSTARPARSTCSTRPATTPARCRPRRRPRSCSSPATASASPSATRWTWSGSSSRRWSGHDDQPRARSGRPGGAAQAFDIQVQDRAAPILRRLLRQIHGGPRVTMAPTGDATFFATAAEFRRWLERNHAEAKELWVGFYKKGTGKPSITWPEAVAEALCFGWIDGVRRSIDEHSYRIRFTPRKPNSIWSAVNIRTAQELIAAGRMRPAGLAAFQNRREDLQGRYSFEQGAVAFEPWMETEFRKRKEAWAFFEAQPPSYRK